MSLGPERTAEYVERALNRERTITERRTTPRDTTDRRTHGERRKTHAQICIDLNNTANNPHAPIEAMNAAIRSLDGDA